MALGLAGAVGCLATILIPAPDDPTARILASADGPGVPALLTNAPGPRFVALGDSTLLTNLSGGTGDAYQWLRNGQEIRSATQAVLSLSNLQLDASGTYSCLTSGILDEASITEISVVATTFYISVSGNDALAGTNDATAWATPHQVTNSGKIGAFGPLRTSFLFKRGDVWTNDTVHLHVKAGTNFLLGNYGSGPIPRFVCDKPFTNDWTHVSNTTWSAVMPTYGTNQVLFTINTNDWPMVNRGLAASSSPSPGVFSTNAGRVYINTRSTSPPTEVRYTVGNASEECASAFNFYRCRDVTVTNLAVDRSIWSFEGAGGGFYGFRFNDCAGSNLLASCDVNLAGKHHIGVISSAGIYVISSCTASNTIAGGYDASALVSFSSSGDGMTNVWLNCTVSGVGGAFYSHNAAPKFWGTNGGISIIGCTFHGGNVANEDYPGSFTVQDCRFYTNARPGRITLSAAGGARVERNYSQAPIYLTRSTFRSAPSVIQNNVLETGDNASLWFGGADNSVSPVVIQGNTFVGTYGPFFATGYGGSNFVVRGNLFAGVYAPWFQLRSTNALVAALDYNIYVRTLTNAVKAANVSWGGTFPTWTNWRREAGVERHGTNTMGVAQAVTNGLVPVTQSLAVGFIPWTEAVTWGLTNDFAGNPRPAGLPVTAGAFHVDVAEIGVATEDAGEVVSGAALSYGSVDVNGTGSMTFLVTNAGLAALDLSSVAMSGGDAAEFLVDTHSTEPCVQPGCSTAFRVSFRPTSTGLHTSTLRLVNNDSDECVFTLTLTGVGSNLPPHWTGYTLSTPYQKPATVSLVKLLARATDPEGDGFAVTAVGPSAGGGGVNLGGSSITYVPPGAFSGFDSLPVTLRDARGAVTTGTVTVTVGAGIGIGMNQPRLALSGGGRPLVRFQGIPGRRYDLQRSTNLMTWSTLTNIAANATGGIEFEDTAPPAPQGFYRLRAP